MVLKVIELLSESQESWEAATQAAVKEAAKTVRGIRSVYVKEQMAVVEGDRVTTFRVNLLVTFAIEP